MTQLTEKQKAEIIDMKNNGASTKAIHQRMGFALTTVRRVIRLHNGAKDPPKKKSDKEITPEYSFNTNDILDYQKHGAPFYY